MSDKTQEKQDFEQFLKQRETAAQAYVSGDPAPLGRLVTHDHPATFFGPGGGYIHGAATVYSTYKRDAESFAPGSESHFEILQQAAGDTVAYWTGIQHAIAHLQGKDEPVPMRLRVTEIFRREDGDWKLVHRHADMLAEKSEKR